MFYTALSTDKKPVCRCTFLGEAGNLSVRSPEIKIRNLELQGSYSNGSKASPSTSKLLVDKCSFNIGNALWMASLSAYDFTDAQVSFTFSGISGLAN
jgi:hypothetical protein